MANNLTTEKKVQAISMLAEDSSIRAVERITGIHRDTIMRLASASAKACAKIHDEKMRGLSCKHVEVDEIWGFIGKKKRTPRSSVTQYRHWATLGLSLRLIATANYPLVFGRQTGRLSRRHVHWRLGFPSH